MPRQVKSIEKSMEKSSKIVKNRVSGGLGGSGQGSWGPSWLQDRFLRILCAAGLPTWAHVGGKNFDFMLKKRLKRVREGCRRRFFRVEKMHVNIEGSWDRLSIDFGRLLGGSEGNKTLACVGPRALRLS